MKLSKTMKKIWTYVCVITMVVSSLTFYNDTYVRAAAPDWSGVAYAGDGVGGGKYSNKYKFYCEDSRVNLVNIQKPGFAAADSFYVTFPAGIESSSLGEGKYDPQGAGIAIHLDAFTAQETEFTVTDALGTYTCYVYYEDGEGSEIATPAPTEPAPVEKGDVALSGYNWAIQTPTSEGFAPTEYNGYGFTVQGIAADADQWSYGAVLDAIAVTNGETYTLTLNVKSTVNKVVPIEFTNGTAINRTIAATPEGTTFTYKFTAKADTVKIYMPLGINTNDVEIADAYDVTISDVQFDVTEPDETEPMTTLPADAEVTILEPSFAFDNNTSTKYYELHWNAVELSLIHI